MYKNIAGDVAIIGLGGGVTMTYRNIPEYAWQHLFFDQELCCISFDTYTYTTLYVDDNGPKSTLAPQLYFQLALNVLGLLSA